jgi:hypothetical protein
VIEVKVEVMAGARPGRGLCVIAGDVAAVDLPGLDRPGRIPAGVLPAWLAGLIGLGPRPAVAVPGLLIAPTAVLDRLLAGTGAFPWSVPAEWRGVLARIVECRQAWWRMTMGPPGADPVESLEVIDAGAAGLWARRPCPAAAADDEIDHEGLPLAALAATTPTVVWTWLSRLASPPPPTGPTVPRRSL